MIFVRRQCKEGLLTQCVCTMAVAVIWGALLFADFDLLNVPELEVELALNVTCWVFILGAGTVLSSIYASSFRGESRSPSSSAPRSRVSCEMQLFCAFLSGIGWFIMTNFTDVFYFASWTDIPSRVEVLQLYWASESRGYSYVIVLLKSQVQWLLFCCFQACLRIPFGYCSLIYVCRVTLAILTRITMVDNYWDQDMQDTCYFGTSDGGTLSFNLIQSTLCLYNIWLQEKLARQQLVSLADATALSRSIEDVNNALLPPHVLKSVMMRAHSQSTSSLFIRTGSGGSSDSNELSHDARSAASIRSAAGMQLTITQQDRRGSAPAALMGGRASEIIREGSERRNSAPVNAADCVAPKKDLFFAENLPRVCMLMSDVEGFTTISSKLPAQALFAGVSDM